jgi:hypothetical protein
MISKKIILQQLKKIDFSPHGWNRSEVAELHQIILPDETIYECVNGTYEGGFALLVATDIRLLLVDKKPLNFLKVEDLRFDMINEIDYNHRMMGATINVTTGSKSLNFRSYNKERLRKLIGHVQHCMAQNKKQQSNHAEDQKQHLEQINQQLQAYLVAQYKQQQKLQDHLFNTPAKDQANTANDDSEQDTIMVEPVRPSPQLADYLYANGLLEKYREETGIDPTTGKRITEDQPAAATPLPEIQKAIPETSASPNNGNSQLDEIYADGLQEVYGKRSQDLVLSTETKVMDSNESNQKYGLDPLKIAISKLPMVLRNRKIGIALPSIPSPFPLHSPIAKSAPPSSMPLPLSQAPTR